MQFVVCILNLLALLAVPSNAYLDFKSQSESLYYGTYDIFNCHSKAIEVTNALHALNIYIDQAIRDIDRQSPQWISRAYHAFFKDIRYAPQVRAILRNITLGVPLPDSPDTHPLHIYCVDAPNQIRYRFDSGPWGDPYLACSQPFEKHGLSPAGSIGPNIILCPAFFQTPPIPLKPQCLKVNRFRGDFRAPTNSSADIARSTQVWILLRELTRYYLDLKIDREKNKDVDVREVNDCVRLPAEWARLNAGNYVYYVSNVHSRCWLFPNQGSRRSGRGPELLEVLPNRTLVAANTSFQA